jgi:riboflavin kinase/FMN adenylyltransferase
MGFLIDHSGPVPAAAQSGVVAIGNFDGVHLGHRALLQTAITRARDLGCPSVMMTFEPHPRQFFQKAAEPFRLTFLPAKARIAKNIGIDAVVGLSFDVQLSSMTAQEFVYRILQEKLKAREIVVGEDFHFGKDRQGGVPFLKQHLPVILQDPVRCDDGQVLSSTRVRNHLKHGDLDAAGHLLGAAWEIEEMVIAGQKRGRELGYPTANQAYAGYVPIPFGVYASRILIDGEASWRDAVSNFGIRPMFLPATPMFLSPVPLMETHILGYTGDIYGKNMRLKPLKYLRGEMKFDTMNALTVQIEQDCQQAAAMLKSGT